MTLASGRSSQRSLLARAAAAALVSAATLAALDAAEAGPDGRCDGKQSGAEGTSPRGEKIADWFTDPGTPWSLGDPAGPESSGGAVPAATSGVPLRVVVGPWPTAVHVDVPADRAVSITITRVAGTLPKLLWIEDAAGRAWTPRTDRSAQAMRTAEVVTAFDGGLDVFLSPTTSPVARVSVLVHARTADGADPARAATSPWAPGRIVVSTGASSHDVPYGDDTESKLVDMLGVQVIEKGQGFLVLETPGERTGYEWTDAAWMQQICGAYGGFEPDSYAEPPETLQTNMFVVGSEFGRNADRQPGIKMIGMPRVRHGLDGSGVVIAVVDTGVDAAHPRLAGRVLPGRDFVDGDDDAGETKDGADGDGDGTADDGFGHGTVVGGVALTVAPGAKLLPVRVLDDEGLGTASRVAQGIRWAADHGADVINLSLGTRTWSGVLEMAVLDAVARGAIVVVAAGNDGDPWSVDFPGDVPGVISVTALGINGRRARFGSGRRSETVAAPGVNVCGPYPGNTWARGRGTSFAAPFASGAAALLLEDEPGSDVRDFRAELAPHWRLDVRAIFARHRAALRAERRRTTVALGASASRR